MPTSIMQKNYSNCPLKKRPVLFTEREELINEEENDMEPENLSTKPEDLSRTGRLSIKTETIVSRTPSPLPVTDYHSTQTPVIAIPTPTYPVHYYSDLKSPKSEPLNLHSPVNETLNYVSPANWHKPVIPAAAAYHSYLPFPHYAHHIPFHNSEPYYHHQVSPTRSEQLSPYNQRESSISPPSIYSVQNGINAKRDTSLSPPIIMQPYLQNHQRPQNNTSRAGHRYMPYQIHPHHQHIMMTVDQSSLSPTSSHTSFNSLRSMSPPLAVTSSPEDLSNAPTVLHEKSLSTANIQKAKKVDGEKVNSAPRYQCPDCGKSYSTYSGLSKHQQFHCPAAIGNQAKKSFSCKYCEKVYVSLGALKMHIRTHTLPCKCHTCGKAFSRPWLLQGHIRTHTGEKPFSCQHCHRAFADRSNLRAHLQTHSDVKKYSCASCSKTFSRMSLLTKHNDGGCPGGQMSPPQNNSYLVQKTDIPVF